LHLWGEDGERSRHAPKRRGRKPTKPRPHPCAADADALAEAIGNLREALLPENAQTADIALRLPTDAVGPMDSPAVIRDEPSPPKGKRKLADWSVPSLAFRPADALDLLVGLPESPRPGIGYGSTLLFWREAAKLATELLVGERYFPDIESRSDGWRAVWQPLLEEGGMPERLRLLHASMPPACRAVLRDGELLPNASDLCAEFLCATTDAWVRRALSDVSLLPSRRGRKRKSVLERWLAALTSEDGRLDGTPNQIQPFAEKLGQWTGQLRPAAAESPFRTCFRLVPPEGAADALERRGRRRRRAESWRVTFHLQARDDPSLLVDADRVWRTRSRAATLLKRRVANPQELFLADLGRASRVFPKLDEALRSPRPSASELAVEEAYAFLREAAPLLEQSGFGVLVPPWWKKPTARVGVKLRLKSAPQSAGDGAFGLSSLVDYDWQIAIGDDALTLEEFERIAALKVPLVQVRGQWVELRPEQIDAALMFFKDKQGGQMTLGEAMRLGLAGDVSETGLPVQGIEAEGGARKLMDKLTGGVKVRSLPAPKSFRGTLRPYQKKGFSWLAFLDQFGLGACLADDMGLGKTIQFIALMLHERKQKRSVGPTLLICPMSVVGNWRREVERFAPSLRVMVHHGAERLTGKAFAAEARKHDLVISTYALAHRDREHLAAVSWHRVALDEAQNIKNPYAKQTQAIRSFEAPRRVALTGTPVENRLSELWSIMEFLNPGYLGSAKDFRARFAIAIEKYRDAERAEQLRRLVQPFVLRRLKTDRSIIKDLPEKLEMKVLCNLMREQASLYAAVVKDMLRQIEESEGIQRKGLVLSTLMKLKQVCNHPAQFLHDRSALEGRSGKLARIEEMLDEALSEGDKALVFTQFKEMGDMLRTRLQRALGREVLFLHGSVAKKARDEMVDRFQAEDSAGPAVFILSIKAGGVGLNLTAANRVFHFDRWWNPAVENQATDRAFRIGQRKNVQVHKFVCVGTLEERIDQMIEQKKELAESVIGAGENWITELSTDDLREIFALSKDAMAE